MTAGTTEKLARFIVETGFRGIPPEAVARAKTMLLDSVGVALAGTAVGTAGKIAIKYVGEIGGMEEASVIGGGIRTSAPNAALANGLLIHALDFDDWIAGGHPSGMLVATSLALGEKLDAPGVSVIEAYILGLETYGKIAAGAPHIQDRGWHSTPVYGTMGSAAAAAKLLRLSLHETVMALGIAASSASGILREHGTMTKPYQVGKAARNGVEAALLAREGFTGDGGIIEGPGGFCDCFEGESSCDYSQMTMRPGNPFFIVSPGLGIKPYPCGGIKYFRRIQSVLELKRKYNFSYDDVDRLEVRVSRRQNEASIAEPEFGLQGKFSGKYLCARALLDGKITVDMFTDEKVREPRIKEAMRKVDTIVDQSIPDDWSKTWSSAMVRLKDGRTFTSRVDIPLGDARNPLPMELVLQKYRDNASLVLTKEQVERTLDLLQSLDQLKHVRELMDLLRK